MKQINKFINNEVFFFFAWVIQPKSWETSLKWAIEKVTQRLSRCFKSSYSTLNYPSEIQKKLKQTYKAGTVSFGKIPVNINVDQGLDSPDIIRLASCELDINSGHIDWIKEFDDVEDEVSLHRWNWLMHLATGELCTAERLRWMIAMMEDWVECFQHEVNLLPKDLDHLLRWESYTVGERLANSVLLFHCYNLKPSDTLAQALFEQAKLLTDRLEYFGKNTGNHVCNNARGIYLAGVYFKCESLCKLAREVFRLELESMVTADGFLRGGSSHYQFLFTRWMLEVQYFAKEWSDDDFLGFLEPKLKKMFKQCEFFLMNDAEKQKTLPLFGDISPDEDGTKFMFCHVFYQAPMGVSSEFMSVLDPIIGKINPLSLYRIKANLLTKTSKIIPNTFHQDMLDMSDRVKSVWTTSILYMNTNNGYTEFKDGTIVESVANRFVSFPANTLHRGTSCTDQNIRVVINFNYFAFEADDRTQY